MKVRYRNVYVVFYIFLSEINDAEMLLKISIIISYVENLKMFVKKLTTQLLLSDFIKRNIPVRSDNAKFRN